MIHKVNNICKVEYARVSSISQYQESPAGSVLVSADWQTMPLAKPPRLEISENISKAGRLYESKFVGQLDYKLLNKHLLLVRISFANSEDQLIIGDPDHPVRFLEDHSLVSKRLEFSHAGAHYPWKSYNI